jgi:hypothetical protein
MPASPFSLSLIRTKGEIGEARKVTIMKGDETKKGVKCQLKKGITKRRIPIILCRIFLLIFIDIRPDSSRAVDINMIAMMYP